MSYIFELGMRYILLVRIQYSCGPSTAVMGVPIYPSYLCVCAAAVQCVLLVVAVHYCPLSFTTSNILLKEGYTGAVHCKPVHSPSPIDGDRFAFISC